MSEVTIRLIDNSGNPITGLTGANIKFRKPPYGGGDEIPGLTVVEHGVQGNYQIYGFGGYTLARLFINGVWQQWWGTKWVGNTEDRYVNQAGDTMSGNLNMGNHRILNVGDPTDDSHVGDRGYNDARYLLRSEYVQLEPSYTLHVHPSFTTVIGKRYNNIQAAIDYAAAQNPSNMSYWKIYVYPHHNTVTGYSENLVLNAGIALIGVGGIAKVTGNPTGWNEHVSLVNVLLQRNNNITINNNALLRNCYVRLTGTGGALLTLDTVRWLGGGVMILSPGATRKVVSNGNNNADIWANVDIEWSNSDNAYSRLLSITDIDTAGEPA